MDSAFNAWRQGKELTPEQQRYKAKLPSWQQFMADVMECIADSNNRPHSELPKHEDGRHYTPIEYRDLRMQQENLAPDLLAEAELDVLFRPQEVRKAARGQIELFGNVYFSTDLAELHGEDVRVAYDYDDAEWVYVYKMDGSFVCKAKVDGNKRAAMPITVHQTRGKHHPAGERRNPPGHRATARLRITGWQWELRTRAGEKTSDIYVRKRPRRMGAAASEVKQAACGNRLPETLKP